MTISMVNLIQTAERALPVVTPSTLDAVEVPAQRVAQRTARGALAEWLRATAGQSNRLADRLDPECQAA